GKEKLDPAFGRECHLDEFYCERREGNKVSSQFATTTLAKTRNDPMGLFISQMQVKQSDRRNGPYSLRRHEGQLERGARVRLHRRGIETQPECFDLVLIEHNIARSFQRHGLFDTATRICTNDIFRESPSQDSPSPFVDSIDAYRQRARLAILVLAGMRLGTHEQMPDSRIDMSL